MMKPRLAIIGGKILGPLIAHRTAQRGIDTTLFMKDRQWVSSNHDVLPSLIDPGYLSFILSDLTPSKETLANFRAQFNCSESVLLPLKEFTILSRVEVGTTKSDTSEFVTRCQQLQRSRVRIERVTSTKRLGASPAAYQLLLPRVDTDKAYTKLTADCRAVGVKTVHERVTGVWQNDMSNAFEWTISAGATQTSFTHVIDLAGVWQNLDYSRASMLAGTLPLDRELQEAVGSPWQTWLATTNFGDVLSVSVDRKRIAVTLPVDADLLSDWEADEFDRPKIQREIRKHIKERLSECLWPRHELAKALHDNYRDLQLSIVTTADDYNAIGAARGPVIATAGGYAQLPSMLAVPTWRMCDIPRILAHVQQLCEEAPRMYEVA